MIDLTTLGRRGERLEMRSCSIRRSESCGRRGGRERERDEVQEKNSCQSKEFFSISVRHTPPMDFSNLEPRFLFQPFEPAEKAAGNRPSKFLPLVATCKTFSVSTSNSPFPFILNARRSRVIPSQKKQKKKRIAPTKVETTLFKKGKKTPMAQIPAVFVLFVSSTRVSASDETSLCNLSF